MTDLTTDSMRNLIRSTPARQPVPATTADLVLATTARLFGVTVDEILSGSRARCHIEARQVAMAVLRANSGLSFPQIGAAFNRDHTTVMASVEKVAGTPLLLAWAAAVDLEMVAPPVAEKPTRSCRRSHHGGRS